MSVSPSHPMLHRRHGSSSNLLRAERTNELLWSLMQDYRPNDTESIQKDIVRHVEYTLARTRLNFTKFHAFQATAHSVRDRLVERFNDTYALFADQGSRYVCYLSLEFLVGRSLRNALSNLNLKDSYKTALDELGYSLENLYEEEKDAALGNGGLGRLAACFIDSMATLNLPAWGYGLRYTYGMFEQKIYQGDQIEVPDNWLTNGNPWEIPRLDVQYVISFCGHVQAITRPDGTLKLEWVGTENVIAVAYDTLIPGHHTANTVGIRLWASRPPKEFDMEMFNRGDYMGAVSSRQTSENITNILYPNDNTYSGKQLRLKQEYLLVAATLADIMRRFKKTDTPLSQFHTKVTIQLNDTHPALGIVELMRILVDLEGLQWAAAWEIVQKTFNYTNHTVLPEALEKWPVSLLETILPRHMQIIYEINMDFIKRVEKMGADGAMVSDMSIIEEDFERRVRMANLAIIGSSYVNGVAALHTDILKSKVFKNFNFIWPEKFLNQTNGVTPRRWLQQANPELSKLITDLVGSEDWVDNLHLIANIRTFATDDAVQERWRAVKRGNKQRLADLVKSELGITIDPDMMFDVQVKRIHEYKRQLLNVLGCIHTYHRLAELDDDELPLVVKRCVFFGGKAAPGYFLAKRIIKLIHRVADVVNNDPRTSPYFKVVFLPNYNVRLAETIIPASDISQHISTAGTEASGTSNMKFVMNGGLILGTMDGANVEIVEEAGIENMFIFGLRTDEVEQARQQDAAGVKSGRGDFRFQSVLASIEHGTFGCAQEFQPIINSLRPPNDRYLVQQDFLPFIAAVKQAEKIYRNQQEWTRRCIHSTGSMAKFSSDNTVSNYAKQIWHLDPVRLSDAQ